MLKPILIGSAACEGPDIAIAKMAAAKKVVFINFTRFPWSLSFLDPHSIRIGKGRYIYAGDAAIPVEQYRSSLSFCVDGVEVDSDEGPYGGRVESGHRIVVGEVAARLRVASQTRALSGGQQPCVVGSCKAVLPLARAPIRSVVLYVV